jgi:hypothetical protein
VLRFFLADVGLETVAEAAARRGWAPKTVQNWIARGLLAACPVGPGRGVYLLRVADVDALVPPEREDGRGRPLAVRKKRKPRTKPAPRPAAAVQPPAAVRPGKRRRGRTG